ncbi:MAG: substrate-binding domain-containing protein [Thiohalomonadales bacterium]
MVLIRRSPKITTFFTWLLISCIPIGVSAKVVDKSVKKSAGKTLAKMGPSLLWGGCGITKKAFMTEMAKSYLEDTGVEIILQGGGATKGIRGVAKGALNIGGACRSSMEFSSAERYVKQYPVAWDAIVFIVNKNNPLDSITIQQVRDIYNGKITNWKQLGGANARIDLYARKSAISGVGLTLRELVFYDTEKDFYKGTRYVKSSGPAEKAVLKSVRAFTATGVSSANRRDVKILKVGGKAPTYANIKSGQYILYRPIYLVTKMGEKNHMVLDFLKYVQGEKGKEVIRKAGTVPYTDALHLLGKQYRQNLKAYRASLNKN